MLQFFLIFIYNKSIMYSLTMIGGLPSSLRGVVGDGVGNI